LRVRFKTEGGIAYFPGLSEPVTIDSDELPEEEAIELKRQVEEAHFFDLPAQAGDPPRGAADYRRYTVTVEAGGRSHTVRLADPVEDPDLQRLVSSLDAKAKALRRRSRTRREQRSG
jgi:hypothetical protein